MKNYASPRIFLTKFTFASQLFLKYPLTSYIIFNIILSQTQKEVNPLPYPIASSLLDGIVLAIVEQESTYGYRITQDIQKVLEVSESTLYPVLRRLQKNGCLTTYDEAFAGRNRRYYKITEQGRAQLRHHRIEWENYRNGIDAIFFGGNSQ